ncbi:thioesterase family protein [Thermosynechococcaceae cyanobacterium BACA0444]|uniref:Thioesterase family protein n=1 Tax=Pseudocalidococcus azoricus BACA0444 TaxID=2918990 RepID=A0AAE4JUV3_9CYAN|nr:thioesterase family protein [Pseudocalidococcus azoricus]MDS3859680.1 thioesterase family protein [Pseudocalidococcus azoricus BACA0444]
MVPSTPWLNYPVRVQPHQTDYAGVAWHGSYLAWLEEARIDCLRQGGIEFADLVNLGFDLPVVRLEARYLQALKFGQTAFVRTRFVRQEKVRLCFDQWVVSPDLSLIYFQASVQLVPLQRPTGKILRILPQPLVAALHKLGQQSD